MEGTMKADALTTLVVTQLVITTTGFLGGFLSLARDRRMLRAQTEARIEEYAKQLVQKERFERTQSQLKELYAPLVMLLDANHAVFQKTLGTDLWDFARNTVLVPNNLRIAELLLGKPHLLDSEEIPPSYVAFLEHAFIWKGYQDVPSGLSEDYFQKQATFPREFDRDVHATFERVSARYRTMLAEAAAPGTPAAPTTAGPRATPV